MAREGGTVADEGDERMASTLAPLGGCKAPNKSCRAYVRPCDGLERFRVSAEQQGGHRVEGLPPDARSGDSRVDGLRPDERLHRGRAWSTDEDEEEEERHEVTHREEHRTSREASRPLLSSRLPLKRSRLSPSPATGLIGLPENEFLSDFYECHGFLGIASRCVIRGALVGVMLASMPQCGAVPPPSTPTQGVAEDDDAVERNCQAGGLWSKAAPPGGAALPRNSSTCLMWSAIALGALAQGCPLTHAEWYVGLAEDSLAACSGSPTVELVRAYLGMAILQNFLGEKAKNARYLQCAKNVLSSLPGGHVPEGLRDLIAHASKAWAMEDNTERVGLDGFWTEDAPIQKLPDIFREDQVRSFFLHVNSRANTSLLGATAASAVKLHAPPPPPRTKLEEEDGAGKRGSSSAANPPSGLHPHMLPELLRLKGYIEHDSSGMRSGVGALMFYIVLRVVQTMEGDSAGAIDSFWRSVDLKLRYPGLCRVNVWTHITHFELWSLASGPHRERYEELRASYNRVRPKGFPPAPPYEECTGISDICDHPGVFCRGLPAGKFCLIRPPVEEEKEAAGPLA